MSVHVVEVMPAEEANVGMEIIEAVDPNWRSKYSTCHYVDGIVRIETSAGTVGTGFYLAPGLILTANHVIPDIPTAANAKATFFYEIGRNGLDVRFCPEKYFFCSPPPHGDVVHLSENALDFTIVACDVAPLFYYPQKLPTAAFEPHQRIFAIGHPYGLCKSFSRGLISDTSNPYTMHHTALTHKGSSGSPLFNERWELSGLHHRYTAADGRMYNVGSPIECILRCVASRNDRDLKKMNTLISANYVELDELCKAEQRTKAWQSYLAFHEETDRDYELIQRGIEAGRQQAERASSDGAMCLLS